MKTNQIRITAIPLALAALIVAGPASAIVHDTLPGALDGSQLELRTPSVLLRSERIEKPDVIKEFQDHNGFEELYDGVGELASIV